MITIDQLAVEDSHLAIDFNEISRAQQNKVEQLGESLF